MLTFLTIVVMLVVAYAYFREGLFTAFTMLVNVVLAGVIAFNFWEPVAGSLDSMLSGTFFDGFQDFIVLTAFFALTLGLLRSLTNSMANTQIEFSPTLQQFAGAGVGLVTGYLLSGFLVSAMETLPWHRNFIDFEPRKSTEGELRRYLPADRVWLALMRHASAYGFVRTSEMDNDTAESPYDRYSHTFDRAGTFELRYFRYRRYEDEKDPLPYAGELDQELTGAAYAPAAPAAPATPPATTTTPGTGTLPPGTPGATPPGAGKPAPQTPPTGNPQKPNTPAPPTNPGKTPPGKK